MRVEKREALTEARTRVVDATQHVELVAKLAQAEARFSGKEAALWKVAPPPQDTKPSVELRKLLKTAAEVSEDTRLPRIGASDGSGFESQYDEALELEKHAKDALVKAGVESALTDAAARVSLRKDLKKAIAHKAEAKLWLEVLRVKRAAGSAESKIQAAEEKLAVNVARQRVSSAKRQVRRLGHKDGSIARGKTLAERGPRVPSLEDNEKSFGWSGLRATLLAAEKELVLAETAFAEKETEMKEAGLYTAVTTEEAAEQVAAMTLEIETKEEQLWDAQKSSVNTA